MDTAKPVLNPLAASPPEITVASPTDSPKRPVPTLHHLQNSQSQRILWVLEELGIEYDVVKYNRTPKDHRAPPELLKISPLGKSPVLVTGEGRTIIETAAICAYLFATYDKASKFATQDWITDQELTSFAGASLGALYATELLVELLAKHSPWPIVYLMRAVRNKVQQIYTTNEFRRSMSYLEVELGDQDWFNGMMLGRSDVMISYPLDLIATRGWVDFEKDFPRLAAWRKRIVERPAWKRGLEKGNGCHCVKPYRKSTSKRCLSMKSDHDGFRIVQYSQQTTYRILLLLWQKFPTPDFVRSVLFRKLNTLDDFIQGDGKENLADFEALLQA
ncbi:hypothetical protein G7Y89_g15571 [Cudoniella acicularis]|uniref:Glutathione S-transferase n=1 Tax=Cudoniella acicularis TaxID=354080 RepID=A0A8H4QLN4_9HELO|nr:hypothetical protein G7Y89_g15571 [Cudoniella acicularis]